MTNSPMKPGNSPMKSAMRLTLIVLLGLSATGCVGTLIEYTGSIAGAIAGKKLADAVPPKTKVVVIERGGDWCKTMDKLGGTIPIQAEDRLSDPTIDRIRGVDDWGEKHCPGWKQ